jgi:hypothetical protein
MESDPPLLLEALEKLSSFFTGREAGATEFRAGIEDLDEGVLPTVELRRRSIELGADRDLVEGGVVDNGARLAELRRGVVLESKSTCFRLGEE